MADASAWTAPAWITLPFDAARTAAPATHAADNSSAMHTGSWRTIRPVTDYEPCHKCWSVGSTVRPAWATAVPAGPPVPTDPVKLI